MPVLPDPAELEAIAARIERHADALRGQAARLVATLAGTHWQGVAADAFHAQAHAALLALRGSADRLDTAARALRRHAERVRVLVADLAAAGADSVRAAQDLLVHPDHLLGDAGRLLGDGLDLADDALSLVGL